MRIALIIVGCFLVLIGNSQSNPIAPVQLSPQNNSPPQLGILNTQTHPPQIILPQPINTIPLQTQPKITQTNQPLAIQWPQNQPNVIHTQKYHQKSQNYNRHQNQAQLKRQTYINNQIKSPTTQSIYHPKIIQTQKYSQTGQTLNRHQRSYQSRQQNSFPQPQQIPYNQQRYKPYQGLNQFQTKRQNNQLQTKFNFKPNAQVKNQSPVQFNSPQPKVQQFKLNFTPNTQYNSFQPKVQQFKLNFTPNANQSKLQYNSSQPKVQQFKLNFTPNANQSKLQYNSSQPKVQQFKLNFTPNTQYNSFKPKQQVNLNFTPNTQYNSFQPKVQQFKLNFTPNANQSKLQYNSSQPKVQQFKLNFTPNTQYNSFQPKVQQFKLNFTANANQSKLQYNSSQPKVQQFKLNFTPNTQYNSFKPKQQVNLNFTPNTQYNSFQPKVQQFKLNFTPNANQSKLQYNSSQPKVQQFKLNFTPNAQVRNQSKAQFNSSQPKQQNKFSKNNSYQKLLFNQSQKNFNSKQNIYRGLNQSQNKLPKTQFQRKLQKNYSYPNGSSQNRSNYTPYPGLNQSKSNPTPSYQNNLPKNQCPINQPNGQPRTNQIVNKQPTHQSYVNPPTNRSVFNNSQINNVTQKKQSTNRPPINQFNNSQINNRNQKKQSNNRPPVSQFQKTSNSTPDVDPSGSHPLKITPYHTPNLQSSQKFPRIKHFFSIAAAYFRHVLKVTNLPQEQTIYKNTYGCGDIFPMQYSQQGFNQNTTDVVIFFDDGRNVQANNKAGNTLALASLCHFSRRPIYGKIHYITEHMQDTDHLTVNTYIYLIIHQILHILVFNEQNLKNFYTSPTSNTLRPFDQTAKCVGGNCYVITPKVMEYVKNYFNCHDGTGALLDNAQPYSHWSPKVFKDDVSIPSTLPTGNKITALTFALLKDSGFYAFVNSSFQQNPTYGKNRGCEFAQGQQYVQDVCQQDTCDPDHRYGRNCHFLIPTYQKKQTIYNNVICEYIAPGNNPGYANYFGNSSRCFNTMNTGRGKHPECYKAKCVSGKISITIKEKQLACNSPGEWLQFDNQHRVQCPKSFDQFCGVAVCYDQCLGKGLCVKGQCLYPN